MRGIPIGDEKDHAGEEAGFGGAKQETQHQEGSRSANQRERAGDEAPRDHDAGDPGARAKPLQSQIARHFQKEIAEKEDARAEAIGLGIDADRLVHLQRGEADIHAVDVVDQIGSDQEWHQTPGHPKDRFRFQFAGHGRRRHCCSSTTSSLSVRGSGAPSSTKACRNRSLLHKRKIRLPLMRGIGRSAARCYVPCNLEGEHDG